MLIAANVPDVDVLAYVWGPTVALSFRRGITHGLPAVAVWPFVLLGVMLAWDRLVRRRNGRIPERPAVGSQLLLLAFLGVATHPTLDFLNTYGTRWLAPFSYGWFYGDTLFIVDPWVWGMLTVGILLARRREAGRGRWEPGDLPLWPALVPLALLLGYVLLMAGGNLYARRVVRHELAVRGVAAERLMVAPTPVTPFRKWVVAREGAKYHFGRFDFLADPQFALDDFVIPAAAAGGAGPPELQAPEARRFLSWARFPFYEADGSTVWLGDARYTLDAAEGWASTAVRRER